MALCIAGMVATATPAGAVGVIEMVSVDASGAPLHHTFDVSMSDDGRTVAFIADSSSGRSVVVRDRSAGTSTTIHPGPAAAPIVSGDGSTVVFSSMYSSVLAYDRATGTSSVVSIFPDGTAVPSGTYSTIYPGGVSHDGRYVSFSFWSGGSPMNGVYLRDLVDATTVLVSTVDPLLQPSSFGAGPVSDDGGTVAFVAYVRPPGHSYSNHQAFVWTRSSPSPAELVSVDAAGAPAPTGAFVDDMTPDGRFVALQTTSRLADADPNTGVRDIYVRDRTAATTSFVGESSSEERGANQSASLSDDGRYVAHLTSIFSDGGWGNELDVAVADRAAGTVELATLALDGSPAGGAGGRPELSGDGRFVAFVSSALDLVPPFDTFECREWIEAETEEEEEDEDGYGWWQPPQMILDYTQCSNAYVLDRAATGGHVTSGGTISDGSTSVQLPTGVSGTVTITPVTEPSPVPEGYEILGEQLAIEAPPGTWDNPLRLTFTVPASTGVPAEEVTIVRDGVVVADCPGSTTALPPDAADADGHPCVTSRSTDAAGNAVLVVLTPHASVWSLTQSTAVPVTFESLAEATTAATSREGVTRSLLAKVDAAAASSDRGDATAAIRTLDAYTREVAAQSGKALTADAATALLEQAGELRLQLEAVPA